MRLESKSPLRVRWHGQEWVVQARHAVLLPDSLARLLLHRVPAKVRIVDETQIDRNADVAEDMSPYPQTSVMASLHTRYPDFRRTSEQRIAAHEPWPLQPGWIVVYRGRAQSLQEGTVEKLVTVNGWWRITLTNGNIISEAKVVSIGRTNGAGSVVESWLTRVWGLDGRRR